MLKYSGRLTSSPFTRGGWSDRPSAGLVRHFRVLNRPAQTCRVSKLDLKARVHDGADVVQWNTCCGPARASARMPLAVQRTAPKRIPKSELCLLWFTSLTRAKPGEPKSDESVARLKRGAKKLKCKSLKMFGAPKQVAGLQVKRAVWKQASPKVARAYGC